MKIIFLFLITILSLHAQDFQYDEKSGKAVPSFIGELKNSRGPVKKRAGLGNASGVTKDTKFYVKDALITEKNAFAKILMIDDSVLTFGGNTEYIFEDFKFKDKNDRQSSSMLSVGQMRGLIKNKVKEGEFKFKTSSTSMAVRGTEFFMNRRKLKELEIVEFALLDGEVEIILDDNEQYRLEKLEHLILLKNAKGNKVIEKLKLDEEMLAELKKEEALMPYYELNENPLDPKFNILFHKEESKIKNTEFAKANESKKTKGNWRKNLKKLNQQLRENHLKREEKKN